MPFPLEGMTQGCSASRLCNHLCRVPEHSVSPERLPVLTSHHSLSPPQPQPPYIRLLSPWMGLSRTFPRNGIPLCGFLGLASLTERDVLMVPRAVAWVSAWLLFTAG